MLNWFTGLFCRHNWILIEDENTPVQARTLTVMDYYTKVSKCSKCFKEKEHN